MTSAIAEICLRTGICVLGFRRTKEIFSMTRMAKVAIVAIFVLSGAVTVIAQSDPIATRRSLMKENDQNAVIVVRMMRGMARFDAAKVDAAFAQWADTAQKLPGLFPDTSKTGQNTRAASKIWVTRADFDAKAAADRQGGRREPRKGAKLTDGLRAAIPVSQTPATPSCGTCGRQARSPAGVASNLRGSSLPRSSPSADS